jgi:hemolysin activation/secretion protein
LALVAVVSRKPFSGLATVDNRAYKLTGPIEGLTVIDGNSFTQFGEETEVSLYHTFPNSETFGQASTEFFVGGSGLKLKIYGGSGRTNPTGPLGAVGFEGITNVFGAMASYPVIRSRQQTLNVHVSFDGLESTIDVNPDNTRQSFDSLRVLRASADYALADLWAGGDRAAVARPANPWRDDPRRCGGLAAPGRADRFYQGRFQRQPHANPVQALE